MSTARYPRLDALFSTQDLSDRRPPQFLGTLKTGEFVYAKARETRMLVEVYAKEDDFGLDDRRIGFYRLPVEGDAGFTPFDVFADYIADSIEQFVASRKS